MFFFSCPIFFAKEKYPDIEGVSCGAILSSYQRFRVENVCGRLGVYLLHIVAIILILFRHITSYL